MLGPREGRLLDLKEDLPGNPVVLDRIQDKEKEAGLDLERKDHEGLAAKINV